MKIFSPHPICVQILSNSCPPSIEQLSSFCPIIVEPAGEADGALGAGGEAALQAGGGAVHRPGLSTEQPSLHRIHDEQNISAHLRHFTLTQILSHLICQKYCIYYETHVKILRCLSFKYYLNNYLSGKYNS